MLFSYLNPFKHSLLCFNSNHYITSFLVEYDLKPQIPSYYHFIVLVQRQLKFMCIVKCFRFSSNLPTTTLKSQSSEYAAKFKTESPECTGCEELKQFRKLRKFGTQALPSFKCALRQVEVCTKCEKITQQYCQGLQNTLYRVIFAVKFIINCYLSPYE